MARSAASKSTVALSKKPATITPPSPFEPAPDVVKSLLDNLAKDHVYITHIDPHPPAFKKQIFVVPVLLNFLFVALLAWRAYVILPVYTSFAQSLWHMRESTIRDFYGSGIGNLLRNEIRHFITIVIDYSLVVFVAPWPYSFFFERPGNPTSWRARIGFQQRELVVRISRSWTVQDLLYGDKKGDESPFWKVRVLPAVQMDKLGKTGYLLMDKSWDLDFFSITVGQQQLGKDYKDNDINGKLWCFWKPTAESPDVEGYWVTWDFRKELYMIEPQESQGSSDGDAEEGKQMIMRFHDKLTDMGKEELFFKWVELIQYESSKPGGFTTERQIEAGGKVKELFDQFGVDFEKFEEDAGIKDGRLVS